MHADTVGCIQTHARMRVTPIFKIIDGPFPFFQRFCGSELAQSVESRFSVLNSLKGEYGIQTTRRSACVHTFLCVYIVKGGYLLEREKKVCTHITCAWHLCAHTL